MVALTPKDTGRSTDIPRATAPTTSLPYAHLPKGLWFKSTTTTTWTGKAPSQDS